MRRQVNKFFFFQEEEPLNSEDDVSDEDPMDLFDTDNVVVCQYDKVHYILFLVCAFRMCMCVFVISNKAVSSVPMSFTFIHVYIFRLHAQGTVGNST